MVWEHDRLAVYLKSLRAAAEVDGLAGALPVHRRYLRDQLRRSVSSVVLNIAEGAGEFSPAEKARFYRMARRSAAESAANIDLLLTLGVVKDAEKQKRALAEVAAMLTTMITRSRRADPGEGPGPRP